MKDTQALLALRQARERFDLIFLDPPYRMDTAPVCRSILEMGLMKEEGIIVVEHARETPPAVQPPLECFDSREYGAAGLRFYRIARKDGSP